MTKKTITIPNPIPAFYITALASVNSATAVNGKLTRLKFNDGCFYYIRCMDINAEYGYQLYDETGQPLLDELCSHAKAQRELRAHAIDGARIELGGIHGNQPLSCADSGLKADVWLRANRAAPYDTVSELPEPATTA